MSGTHIYTDGPEDKPNGSHLVELVRAADIADFIVCRMPDGSEEIVHRAKLKAMEVKA